MKSLSSINPNNITRINVIGPEPSDKFMVRQYNTRTSWFGIRKKLKTPKFGIVCVDHAIQVYQSIDDFFKNPQAKNHFLSQKSHQFLLEKLFG